MKTTFKQFIGEALITEGQFSWMTQDTGRQIGSEKENTITVTMFDNQGNTWTEKKYDGYGEFDGKDYYELLAQMNGIENADRQDGIDIAFGKKKVKGKVLFPALVEFPNSFNWKRHDFTKQPENDPNQSWYQEEDDYDEYDESVTNESVATKLADKIMNMDYAVFKSLGLRSGGELYSNKMMQKKYVDAMKAAIDKAGIADEITKNGQAIYDELEDNNYHSTNAFLVLGGYILPKLVNMYKEIAKSSPNSTLQPFNESLVTESKVTFYFKEFDNSLHFSDGAIVKIDYDGDFEYRGKWFTIESDVEKQLNKAFPTNKFIHETTKDK
jgi:hypothetical protein